MTTFPSKLSNPELTGDVELVWAKAVDRFHFLQKLFWFRDDNTPFMIRDETESHRNFFGGALKRRQCLAVVTEQADLLGGLSSLYEAPAWTFEHLQHVHLKGPWFRDQGLPKLLRLLSRHDPSHAPSNAVEFKNMVEVFDEIILDRQRESSEVIEAESLMFLKSFYGSDRMSLLQNGLILLREERIAWIKANGRQPPTVDVWANLPTIAEWLQLLEKRASK